MTMSIPQHIDDELKMFASAKHIELEEVRQEYLEIRSDEFIATDAQFGSDEERDLYALQACKVRMTSAPKTEEFKCVPVGFGGLRYTSGKGSKEPELYSEIFGLFPEVDSTPTIRRIQIAKKADPETYKTLNYWPPHLYTVLLSRFQSGDFRAGDARSKWQPNKALVGGDGSPMDTLNFVKRCSIAEVPQNVAQKKGGYTDTGDWRCIEGIVVRVNSGDRKDGLRWALLEIGDGSLYEVKQVDEKRELKPTITCWTTEELLPNEGDKVQVFGTIAMNETDFSMQAYMVRQLITMPTDQEEEPNLGEE